MLNHNEHHALTVKDILQRSSQRKSFNQFPLNIKKIFAQEITKTDCKLKTTSKNASKFYVQNLTFQNPKSSENKKEEPVIVKEPPIKHLYPPRISTENNWSHIKSLCQSLLKEKKASKKVNLCQIELPSQEEELLKISKMKKLEKNMSNKKRIKSSTAMRVFNKKSLSAHKIFNYIHKMPAHKTLESENSNVKISIELAKEDSKPAQKQRKSQPFIKKTISRKMKTEKSEHNLDPCIRFLHLERKSNFQTNNQKRESKYRSKRMNKSEKSKRKKEYFKNEGVSGWDISENQIFLHD